MFSMRTKINYVGMEGLNPVRTSITGLCPTMLSIRLVVGENSHTSDDHSEIGRTHQEM